MINTGRVLLSLEIRVKEKREFERVGREGGLNLNSEHPTPNCHPTRFYSSLTMVSSFIQGIQWIARNMNINKRFLPYQHYKLMLKFLSIMLSLKSIFFSFSSKSVCQQANTVNDFQSNSESSKHFERTMKIKTKRKWWFFVVVSFNMCIGGV